MTGDEIMNKVVTYSTPELDDMKSQMAQVLDKMAAYVPTLKEKGMSVLDIHVNADTMIRQQARRIINKTGYMVERDGRKALLGIGRENVNTIVDMFNSQIK